MYIEHTIDLAWAVRRAFHYSTLNDCVIMYQHNYKYTIHAGNDVLACIKGLNKNDIILSIISGKIIINSAVGNKNKFVKEIIGQILSEIS